jgi:1,4-alpha-glucan branching enzyme
MEVTHMVTKKTAGKSEVKSKSPALTNFEFSAPEAQKVSLGGDFNNWDTQATPMKKNKNGIWKVTVNMKPGRYEYRFFVDGKWENDLSCTGCVPNEFGSMNCVKIVELDT